MISIPTQLSASGRKRKSPSHVTGAATAADAAAAAAVAVILVDRVHLDKGAL
jgi:hypothetical protein